MCAISRQKMLAGLIVVVLMTGATSEAADVTYDYTGQPFTYVEGDVTTSQFITASATFTNPVFPATAVAPSSFTISFAGPGLPSFSITELDVVSCADFNFDASGAITSWRLYARDVSEYPPMLYELRTCAGPLQDPYPDADILGVSEDAVNIHGGRSDVPGAWVRRALPVVIDFEDVPAGTYLGTADGPLVVDGFVFEWIGFGEYQQVVDWAGDNVVVDSVLDGLGSEDWIYADNGDFFYFNSMEYGNRLTGSVYRIDVRAFGKDGAELNYIQLQPTTSGLTLTAADLGVEGVLLSRLRINLLSSSGDFYYDDINVTPLTIHADCDRDRDVDLNDFSHFAGCFNGPNRAPLLWNCGRPDLDDDGDVDLTDFSVFAACFNGPNRPPACEPDPWPPGMILIPAGEFQMGDTFNEGSTSERPVHAVYVSAFYMDRYEVTKELWDTVRTWGLSNGYTDLIAGEGKAANHPVQTVNWYDCVKWANARSEKEGRTPCYYTDAGLTTVYKAGELAPYVKWDANGYRLPTEAEWEKAARGGTAGRRFPWSDSDLIQHARANYYSHWSGGAPNYSYDTSPTEGYHPTFAVGDIPYTSPVGYFAPNGYGLYDMAGNVFEWCNDWYGSTYYSSSPYSNPRGPWGSWRVLRGGSWGDYTNRCRVADRGYSPPGYRFDVYGFRVVCSVGGVD